MKKSLSNYPSVNRRLLLRLSLASTAVLASGALRAQEQLEATPTCGEGPTPKQSAGPYYFPRSPLKKDFRSDAPGQSIALIGRVVDINCRPLSNVTIDMWQADARGEYDNVGFKMRGHQVTNASGLYHFETIMPGRYPGRTPHFHVMLLRGGHRLLVTQLYFPNEAGNTRDPLFDSRLLVRYESSGGQRAGRFDFVLEV